MVSKRWTSWAGVAAILGGLTAIVLTPAFATAYFLVYPGDDGLPFWFSPIESQLDSVLAFSSSTDAYNVYGRIFTPVYLLFLPAAVGRHQLHRGSISRMEKRAFVVLVAGLAAASVGVAGDY